MFDCQCLLECLALIRHSAFVECWINEYLNIFLRKLKICQFTANIAAICFPSLTPTSIPFRSQHMGSIFLLSWTTEFILLVLVYLNASCDYLWHHMFYKIGSVPLFKMDLKNITIQLKGPSKSSCHFPPRHSQALRAILCSSLVTVMGHLSRMESSSG